MQIYHVIARPQNWVGYDEDREVGYFTTRERAEQEAADWVAKSRPPHAPRQSGLPCCAWETEVYEITLDQTRPYFGR